MSFSPTPVLVAIDLCEAGPHSNNPQLTVATPDQETKPFIPSPSQTPSRRIPAPTAPSSTDSPSSLPAPHPSSSHHPGCSHHHNTTHITRLSPRGTVPPDLHDETKRRDRRHHHHPLHLAGGDRLRHLLSRQQSPAEHARHRHQLVGQQYQRGHCRLISSFLGGRAVSVFAW